MSAAKKKLSRTSPTAAILKPLDMVSLYIRLLPSPKTRKDYESIWTDWCAVCVAPFAACDPLKAEEVHAAAFVEACRRRGCADVSVRHYVAVLHSIYGWLQEKGAVDKNIFADASRALRKARAGEIRPSQPLTAEQVASLLDAPAARGDEGVRDRAILALLFCGFRVGEVLKARLKDWRQTTAGTKYLHLQKTKSGHGQDRAVPAWCAERIEAQVTRRRQAGAGEDSPIIARLTGQGMAGRDYHDTAPSHGCICSLLRRYADAVGLPPNITPHWGRCTAITCMLEQGAKPEEIKLASGHSSVGMVYYYSRRKKTLEQSAAHLLQYGPKKPV